MREADVKAGERRRSSRIKRQSSIPISPTRVSTQVLTQAPQVSAQTTPQSATRSHTPTQTVKESVEKDLSEEESSGGRGMQKRKRDIADQFDPLEESWKPLTDEDRKSWKGWIELESEPAHFNFLLQEYGIQCVKIQEVFSLDDESLAMLSNPIYGMVFLFKYRNGDAQDDPDTPECPDHVWFANQTTDNACATIAIMNIIMNVPDIDLGPKLEAFKKSTQALDSPHRGQKLGDNAFIRGVHNSFLRRSDVLAADLNLQDDFKEWVKLPKRRVKKNGSKKHIVDEDNSAYHFIAYVPVAGEVWRLDGLQRDPTKIGIVGKDWVSVARDNIMMRINQYEGKGIDYSLLALTRCPIKVVLENISRNLHSLAKVETVLDEQVPDWKLFVASENPASSVKELQREFGFSSDEVAEVQLSELEEKKLNDALSDPSKLLNLYKTLAQEHEKLNVQYMQELSTASADLDLALQRKRDDTPLVYKVIKALADNGVLRDLVEAVKAN